ncbi:MAG TPA: glycosyltransferase [Paludibacteraceae bacterium]|nr:glycosyltransferase [Paludibacteraceae bacterium]HOL29242.1 glycosyltransferase [Paludibacteraceae bacterium]HRT81377.1 glycosyltransferase [Bacteroidales bacterium]
MENSIEIVLVLYHCSLDDSATFSTLGEPLKRTSLNCELILFNNDQSQKIESTEYYVVNSNENVKLAGAYNFALERARVKKKNWILLLDQDTVVPENYFTELEKLFSEGISKDLAAIVPRLEYNDRQISPVKVSRWMRMEQEMTTIGYTSCRMNALNSLSLFRVDFLSSIGGFNKDYPFDMLDHWSYNQIHKHGKLVYIMDTVGKHNSSFVDFETNVSVSRYKEFMDAQKTFIRKELGIWNYLFYKVKLLIRGFSQLLKYKNKRFAEITFASIFKR